MKKLVVGMTLICVLVLTSCQNPAGGGNDGNSDKTEQEDIYYVKYEVIASDPSSLYADIKSAEDLAASALDDTP